MEVSAPANPIQEAHVPAPTHPAWGAVTTLAWREIVRFFRQRNRVIGAVATPLVFWLMLGLGRDRALVVGGDETTDGLGYLAYFFSGVVVLMVLFTAIFTTISVIEDRKEGFLQAVLVSPAPRWAIVLGKALGGTAIAVAQGALMMALGLALFDFPGVLPVLGALGVLTLIALGLTGLGLCIAWPMDSTAGFHAVMNLLLMPMWMLCGAVFPVATAVGAIKVVMYLNPLTYGQALFTSLWTGGQAPALAVGPGLSLAALVLAVGLTLWGATRLANRPSKES